MPEVSRFAGIVITMYFNDHDPPHFHVRYGEHRASIGLDPVVLQEGELPRRIFGLVSEWGRLHREELQKNWTLLATEGTFSPIPPLP
jgi:hypothetical protein